MTTPHARARDIAELAVLVPYILGFHPRDSVVLLAFEDRELLVTQRLDLVHDTQAAGAAAQQMIRSARDNGGDRVVAICFEDGEGGSRTMRRAVIAGALAAGLGPTACIVVRDGRWYDPDETTGRQPDTGRELPPQHAVPGVAAFVAEGRAPAPSRESLRTGMAPGSDPLAAAVEVVLGQESSSDDTGDVGEWSSLWGAVLDPGARLDIDDLSAQQVATLVLSLRDIGWRDALMTVLCPTSEELDRFAHLPTGEALDAVASCPWALQAGCEAGCDVDCSCGGPTIPARLGQGELGSVDMTIGRLGAVVRRVPRADAAPVLTLTALLAWWAGEGAVASLALEQALDTDPGYRLARLLDTLVEHGMRLPAAA